MPLNLGQASQPADVPLAAPIPVNLVANIGDGPLTLTAVQLWEELPAYLPDGGQQDGGGPTGGILSACNPSSPSYDFSDCSRFVWAPGASPADLLPLTLDGGASPSTPSLRPLGRLFIGCLADGGSCPPVVTRYRVYALVSTSDPYVPQLLVPITAYVRYLP